MIRMTPEYDTLATAEVCLPTVHELPYIVRALGGTIVACRGQAYVLFAPAASYDISTQLLSSLLLTEAPLHNYNLQRIITPCDPLSMFSSGV
jgi:hypothetical protein